MEYKGTGIEIRDRIAGSIDWSDIYYKTRSKQFLRIIINVLINIEEKVTLENIYNLTDRKTINNLKNKINDEKLRQEITQEIINNKSYEKESEQLRSQLRNKIFKI